MNVKLTKKYVKAQYALLEQRVRALIAKRLLELEQEGWPGAEIRWLGWHRRTFVPLGVSLVLNEDGESDQFPLLVSTDGRLIYEAINGLGWLFTVEVDIARTSQYRLECLAVDLERGYTPQSVWSY